MGQPEWLDATEKVMDSWAVFVGEDGPTSEKITGRLYVTDKRVCFDADMHMEAGAAAAISNRVKAFHTVGKLMSAAFDQIDSVRVSRKFLFLKSLHIRSKDGGEVTLRFGAMSPDAAYQAISTRITK